MEVLDNAVRSSLDGAHAALAERHGGAARYPTDVSPFAALPDRPAPSDWADLARLVGPGGDAVVFRAPFEVPAGWRVLFEGRGVQLVGDGVTDGEVDDVVILGLADAAEVLDLVGRTRPGPFEPRTMVLGRYLGVRAPDGTLVAMAGERLRPDGACEISAVCTDPAWRGRGLAGRLTRAVVAGIRARGEVAFLHAAADNVPAIRLYLAMGFAHRRDVAFARLRAPEPGGHGG